MPDLTAIINANMDKLKNNVYPGRGIILGKTPDNQNFVQVYWIMGRSANSRNRIFFRENNGFIKTQAYDEAKVTDPSLIIYYPAKQYRDCHIITNGDQTETVFEALRVGDSFESALDTREFEPDAPNFTPRISGLIDLDETEYDYKLSIIKSTYNNQNHCERYYFNYQTALAGVGHCLHTYAGDGNPIPSFQGEPYPVMIMDDLDTVAREYWSMLNDQNKVSLLVKFINRSTGQVNLKIYNKNLGE